MQAIKIAITAVGSAAKLAAALGVKPPTVFQWLNNDRPIPIERCVAIERATNGAVTRRDLRPDDWAEIWPELVADPTRPVTRKAA